MQAGDVKGSILRQGELMMERTAGTFRSPWVARSVVLTDVGMHVFETPKKRGKDQPRGAFLLMIPLETINGVMIEKDVKKAKKRHLLVLATFFKDHRFLCPSEMVAQEWRRIIGTELVGRRKQATVRGRQRNSQRNSVIRLQNLAVSTASSLADAEAAENEELNALLALYLERRTAVLDELMRREQWAVHEEAKSIREAITAELNRRQAA